MASPAGRGAQVRLDGEAQAAARGAVFPTLAQTLEAKRLLEYAGAVGDGSTRDGSTLTGIAAEDEVLAPGGVLAGGGGGGSVTFGQTAGTAAEGNDPRIVNALAAADAANTYATKASPALTGIPTTPTPQAGIASQQIVNAQWVRGEINALVNSAPGTLDTLAELAAALGDSTSFATSVTNTLTAQAARITALETYISSLMAGGVSLYVDPGYFVDDYVSGGTTATPTNFVASGYIAAGYFATA